MVSAAAGKLYHRELSDQERAGFIELREWGGSVVEYLFGERRRTPGGDLSRDAQQVLRAEGDALERAAEAFALEIAIDQLCALERFFGEWKGKCVVACA